MLHASSSENLRLAGDPWIPRLPTPAYERKGFMSPPLSRGSSTASLASLAGEKYTSLRPLPSPNPAERSTGTASTASTPVTDESVSPTTGSKTHAFFSAPFSIAIARSPPSQPVLPQQPQFRSTSLTLPKKKPSRETSLDSSSSIFTDEPAVNSPPMSPLDDAETPSAGPTRSQSTNSNFLFGAPAAFPSSKPAPPPNLEPIARKKPSGTLPGFSTLSRFFPLKHRHSDHSETEEQHVHITEPTPPPSVGLTEGLPILNPVPVRAFIDIQTPNEKVESEVVQTAVATPTTPQPLQLLVPSPSQLKPRISTENLQSKPALPLQAAHLVPIRRETDRHQQYHSSEPTPGQILGAPETPLKLIKLLGEGAFSSVWLASDETAELALSRSTSIGRGLGRQGSAGKRVTRRRPQSKSVAKKERDSSVAGLAPPMMDAGSPAPGSTGEEPKSPKPNDDSPFRALWTSKSYASLKSRNASGSRLVAVKMMDRALCDANDRTRISFVREVEVLRHISHPSIVSYLHSFTTPTHHCLVLEHVAGGELWDLLNTDDKHARITEPLLRRMFSELCRAVAWMHSVALVHRDIKLENILLTCNPFEPQYCLPGTATPSLSLLPAPLLKLTDFGLSRFIDPDNPLLATRCGSESYAAPEIVMAMKYDGRQTDAWACGVVLFALATRMLPFDVNSGGSGSDYGGSGLPSPSGSVSSSIHMGGERSRRSYLIRIAKNEYTWPTMPGSQRLATEGLRRVVERLLVRDPKRRATVAELWDEEWMKGEGGTSKPGEGYRINLADDDGEETPNPNDQTPLAEEHPEPPLDIEAESEIVEPDPDSGLLVDGDSIQHIARLDIV